MDFAGLINDLLIMASAIGSAIAGVLCGWQLRGGHELRKHQAASRPRIEEVSIESAKVVAVDAVTASSEEDFSFLPSRPVANVLFEAPDDSFLRYEDSFALAYGEQPQGLSQTEIRKVAERLINMAELISADVDAHDARISEVNTTLDSKSTPPTMDSVMSAVEKLLSANVEMQDQLRSSRDQIVEQARQIETAETRANTDALTQVSNRRAFDRALSEWSGETPGVLALLDIDHFKRFNDQHGHRAGDEVLKAVAAVLRTELRPHCMVARYGGEEFGLVFTQHRLEDILEVIEAARCAIAANEVQFEGESFRVTCSLGVTRMLADEPSAEWLQRADDGLYLSKDAGRDCGHCIDSKTVGKRESPYRLDYGTKIREKTEKIAGLPQSESLSPPVPMVEDQASNVDPSHQRQLINAAIIERTPNCASLSESYRDLLQRIGKAPVNLSVVALTIVAPEQEVEHSEALGTLTRYAKLIEVAQDCCSAVDRVGYYDAETVLMCMPGTESATIIHRATQLKEIAMKQLQVDDSELHVGAASLELGDNFESLVLRAIGQSCMVQ